jgi:hypothetical protein
MPPPRRALRVVQGPGCRRLAARAPDAAGLELGRGLASRAGSPCPHESAAGGREPAPSLEQPRAPLASSRVWEPHKGNGKSVSHQEARLLPGLQAHKETFVLERGRHFRALSNAGDREGISIATRSSCPSP